MNFHPIKNHNIFNNIWTNFFYTNFKWKILQKNCQSFWIHDLRFNMHINQWQMYTSNSGNHFGFTFSQKKKITFLFWITFNSILMNWNLCFEAFTRCINRINEREKAAVYRLTLVKVPQFYKSKFFFKYHRNEW